MRTHLDLFSGIGGFALACRWNNIQTVGFVEYEDYPRRVLSKQFPGVPIFGDIHDFDATPFRGVDLITGGFPCPPFSVAGKQRGKEDDRYLWPEMLRVIVEAQPRWVLAENVAGLINMELDTVCADLEAEDYATGTLVVPACAKNALHRRDRVWIIARSLGNPECLRQSQPEHEGRSRSEEGIPERSGPDVAHTSIHGTQGLRASGIEESHPHAGQEVSLCRDEGRSSTDSSFKFHLGRRTDGLSEGLDMPRRWGDGSWEEGIPRVTMERKNRTARLKALGNAIVPQIAYELIRCMKEIDESE